MSVDTILHKLLVKFTFLAFGYTHWPALLNYIVNSVVPIDKKYR